MFVLRHQPKGARIASFGIGLCVFALMPTEIGYQDIASLLARQPGVAERWQKRVFSAASSIQLATYSFGHPIGTSTPQSATYRLASLDNQDIDITGSVTMASTGVPRGVFDESSVSLSRAVRMLSGAGVVPAGAASAGSARPNEMGVESSASYTVPLAMYCG